MQVCASTFCSHCSFDWTVQNDVKIVERITKRIVEAIRHLSKKKVSRVSKEKEEGDDGFWYFSYFRYHSSSKAAANTVTQGAPSCLITNGS